MLESIPALFCDPVYDFIHALKCIKFTLCGKNVTQFENIKVFFAWFNPLSTELFGDFYAYGTDLIFCYMD